MMRLKRVGAVCWAMLALSACAMEGATATDVAGENDLTIGTIVRPTASDATILTVFADAGFSGTSASWSLGTTTNPLHAIRLVPTSELTTLGLFDQISTARLACGSRAAQVIFYVDHNEGTMDAWSPYGVGTTLTCSAGQTVTLDLHSLTPSFGDRIASIYMLRRAYSDSYIPISYTVERQWTANAVVPDGATLDGGPVLRLLGDSAFEVTQSLQVDSFYCEQRAAELVVRAQMGSNRQWVGSVVSTYVDTGWGDDWGCRSQMQSGVASGAHDAALQLASSMTAFTTSLPAHPDFYLVPELLFRDFSLFMGGEPVPSSTPPPRPPVGI